MSASATTPVHVPVPVGLGPPGHVRIYTFGDVNVRYRTMLGKAVLSPFGFDSFGLPAENAAIKAGTTTDLHRGAHHRAQIVADSTRRRYDWRREIRSHDPEIIRWSQTIFLEFLKAVWPTARRRRSTGARVRHGARQ